MNEFSVGLGLVSLKEMRYYEFVFLYFGVCCVGILGCILVFNFFGFVFFIILLLSSLLLYTYIYIYIFVLIIFFTNLIKIKNFKI